MNDDTTTATVRSATAAAPDVAAESNDGDGARAIAEVTAGAERVRAANHYDGTLTAKLVTELAPVLHQPTPPRYVEHVPPTEGKPYESTGLRSAQFQIDLMNAGYGRPHWRPLRHYPAGREGYLCKVVILVGNRLAAARLDEHGELVAGDADVLAISEEWGAVKRANTSGDAYKGSATNAIKRALAAFGPGADVYRLEFDDENLGGTGPLTAPALEPAAAPAGRRRGGERTASPGQQRLLRARAGGRGIDDGALANLILGVVDTPRRDFQSPAEARAYLDRLLAQLPARLVDPVLQAIAATPPRGTNGPRSTPRPMPGSPSDGAPPPRPTEPPEGADPATGPAVVPLAPAAVSPNGNAATKRAA